MSPGLVPTLRRSHSSSDATSIDPYNQAEQGFQACPSDVQGARQPLEPRRTFSLRNSVRSSGSTLAGTPGETYELDPQKRAGRPLPRQEPPPRSGTWLSKCVNGIQFPALLRTSLHSSTAEPPDEYKEGYAQFYYERHDAHPNGWPRLAAFMQSTNSFGIYRKFSFCFSRLLITHMSSITEMETKLKELDASDAAGGENTDWRLKNRWHKEGLDTTKRELERNLEKELVEYATLLEKFGYMKSLSHTPARDHDSVFKWIWSNQPLDPGEDDWMFHADDFVSLVPPRRNRFESFIVSHLDKWPNSWFKKIFQTNKQLQQTQDTTVKIYCKGRINMLARLIAVFFAVLILFIPVILFFLTSMSRTWMAVVVLAFDFIFSVMISLLTDAGDKEIFIGTATYCAVLVTFLGNLQGPAK